MRAHSTTTGLGLALVLTATLATTAGGATEPMAAGQYCTDQGGDVVELTPYLQPGSDAEVELAGSMDVCQFISQDGDSPTQVVVDLATLHSKKPTLAGLAYLAQVPASGSGVAGSNPAASYCPVDLAGTEAFGTASSGAWVGALDPGMEAGAQRRSATASTSASSRIARPSTSSPSSTAPMARFAASTSRPSCATSPPTTCRTRSARPASLGSAPQAPLRARTPRWGPTRPFSYLEDDRACHSAILPHR